MIRTFFITLVYLTLAMAVEMAILPQFQMLAPTWMSGWLALPLLACAGILIGLLRGEIPGMAVAIFAAALFGFSQPPGVLGASIASFSLAAFLAGFLARHFRMQGFVFRSFSIGALLMTERLVWWGARWFFWPEKSAEIHIHWVAVVLTALAGALVYKALAPGLKLNLLHAE